MEPIDQYLLLSLQLAVQAQLNGNHPFGAVLVYRGRVIGASENTVNSDDDVTAHAEINLLRTLSKLSEKVDPNEVTLYSSTEPCAMCSGAIYWAGIGSVVFGCSNRALSKIVGGTLEVPCSEILERGIRTLKIIGPIAEDRFRSIHEAFWRR